jgi:hypothetical protein
MIIETPWGITCTHSSNVMWDRDNANAYYVFWSDLPSTHPAYAGQRGY